MGLSSPNKRPGVAVRVISEEFGAAGYPVPATQTIMRQA
jgi:hypothetical protein